MAAYTVRNLAKLASTLADPYTISSSAKIAKSGMGPGGRTAHERAPLAVVSVEACRLSSPGMPCADFRAKAASNMAGGSRRAWLGRKPP